MRGLSVELAAARRRRKSLPRWLARYKTNFAAWAARYMEDLACCRKRATYAGGQSAKNLLSMELLSSNFIEG